MRRCARVVGGLSVRVFTTVAGSSRRSARSSSQRRACVRGSSPASPARAAHTTMPKKKKGGKKKAKKAKVAAAPVLTEEEARKAALVTEVQQLQLRLLREKQLEDRYYQERGRLQEFWELEKDKYRTLKREKATRQRELEDTEEVNGMEIKVWKRSMKHLIHEFQSETTDLRRDLTVGLKAIEDENIAAETLHRVDRRALEVERKKM